MKSFRTDFALNAEPILDLKRTVLTLGSCFAEHIGQRLLQYKWQGLNAPFGTLFHPQALDKILRQAVERADLDEALFTEHDGAFFHHDMHSRFHAADPASLQRQWQALAARVREVLQTAPCVLLTLGTAWVYARKVDGKLTANCHKRPADEFEKRLLSATEIHQALDGILQILPASSPVIISLSPVRHLRDSMILNGLSKSLLLVQIHDFVARHRDRVHYFPAYEIMLDDLRDYRFYEPDMIHPSAEAIDYIWDKFMTCYATDEARLFLRRWLPVLQTLGHRPQRLEAPSYQRHLLKTLRELEAITHADCTEEIAALKARIL